MADSSQESSVSFLSIDEFLKSFKAMKEYVTELIAGVSELANDSGVYILDDAAKEALSRATGGLSDLIQSVEESQKADSLCDTLKLIGSLAGGLGAGLFTIARFIPPLNALAIGLTGLGLIASTLHRFFEELDYCDITLDPPPGGGSITMPAVSPLIFDLDGDGVKTTTFEESTVFFDLNGDGFAQQTAWVSPTDGLLALDRNANGRIDDIGELFGSQTQDGFTQLRRLDSNGDDVIDAADDAFADLRLWVDANSDGISQLAELHSLIEAGVSSINLTAALVDDVNAGNPVSHASTADTLDGTTIEVLDVWFRNSGVITQFIRPDNFTTPDAVAKLPQLMGYGRLPDLHFVMSGDAQLRLTVDNLIANANQLSGADFRAAFEDMILQWAGVVAEDSRGDFIDTRHLQFLESVFNHDFVQAAGLNAGTPNPGPNAALELEETYQDILDAMMTRFSVQVYVAQVNRIDARGSELSPTDLAILEAVADSPFQYLTRLFYNEGSNRTTTRDVDAALAVALGALPQDPALAVAQIDLLITTLKGLRVDLFDRDTLAYNAAISTALAAIDDLALRALAAERAKDLAGLTEGSTGADSLIVAGQSYRGDSVLLRPDPDALIGGAGNDTLSGGFGGDSYLFLTGDGSDVVDDRGAENRLQNDDWGVFVNFGGADQVLFVGRNRADAVLSRDADDLVITFQDGSGDEVRIKGQFAIAPDGQIEDVVFADASLSRDAIDASFTMLAATGGDDDILGSVGADDLAGGAGNDTLRGRDGDDHYHYSRGDGDDVIIDSGSDLDSLHLPDLSPDDITVSRLGADVLIDVRDALQPNLIDGSIRLVDSFSGAPAAGVERIEFSDGTQWSLTDLVIAAGGGLEGGDPLSGTRSSETLNGTLANDIIDGGAGHDIIAPGGGIDLILFGVGSGRDTLNISRSDPFADAAVTRIDLPLAQVSLSRRDSDLLINLLQPATQPDGSTLMRETGDRLLATDHFINETYSLSRLELSDATLDTTEIDQLAAPDNATLHLSGVSLDDLTFTRTDPPIGRSIGGERPATDLTIWAGGSIVASIENQFYVGADIGGAPLHYGLDRLLLDDGTFLDRAAIAAAAPVTGTPFDDIWPFVFSGPDDRFASLRGTEFAETFSSFEGNDHLVAGAGDDTIIGGPGDDRLTGDDDRGGGPGIDDGVTHVGSDSYLYARGDGNDTIHDYGAGSIDSDRLIFSDLNRGDVILSRQDAALGTFIEQRNVDLVITIPGLPGNDGNGSGGTEATIRVVQQFENEFFGLEEIVFANGDTLTRPEILRELPLLGTDFDDRIYGTGVIAPGRGDDTVVGQPTPGFETIVTYALGDGYDDLLNVNVIRFSDLNAADLRFEQLGGQLAIIVVASGEIIGVHNQFDVPTSEGGGDGGEEALIRVANGEPAVDAKALTRAAATAEPAANPAFVPSLDRIEFADGEVWHWPRIADEASVHGSEYSDLLEGSDGDDQLNSAGADDIVYGFAGNDSLTGGHGNDSLFGGDGNDHFVTGTTLGGPGAPDGDDSIDGGLGIDRYDASSGNAAVVINLAAGTASGAAFGSDVIASIEEAVGGSGNDTLSGDAGNNFLSGGYGNDSLAGAGGDDRLEGGAGADTINGGDGIDRADYTQSLGGIDLDLATGAGFGGHADGDLLTFVEDITASSYADIVAGSSSANRFTLGAGDDTANGRGGDDSLDGGSGDDLLTGGEGNDSLTGGAGRDNLAGGAGDDILTGGRGADSLYGGAGGDTYFWFAGDGDDVIVDDGGAPADNDRLEISGVANADSELSRRGDDLYIAFATVEEIYVQGQFALDPNTGLPAGGLEELTFSDEALTLSRAQIAASVTARDNIAPLAFGDYFETSGNTAFTLSLAALTANDTDLDGDALSLASAEAVTGGTAQLVGGDLLFTPETGFIGEALLTYGIDDGFGGLATANITVMVRQSELTGTDDNDLLVGGSIDEKIYGAGGNDWLIGGPGADLLDGGAGRDTASYEASLRSVAVDLANDTATGGDAEGDSFIGIENLVGSRHGDSLTGTVETNVLIGGAGNDVLSAGGGADWLRGDSGADTLSGGTDRDTAAYDTSTAGVAIDLGNGTASGGDATGDQLTFIENLIGSDHDDALTGDNGTNVLVGGNGNDTLDGGAGNDWLRGDAGADLLIGGSGRDTAAYLGSNAGVNINLASGSATGGHAQGDQLFSIEVIVGSDLGDSLTGGASAVTLRGEGGDDSIHGGDGNDWLRGDAGADSLIGGAGRDTAAYNTSGSGVFIDLTAGTAWGGDAAGDHLSGIEILIGSRHNDHLTGSIDANTLRGGAGDDSLNGGAGNDWILGDGGNDILAGGEGRDRFVFNAGFGHDTIEDYAAEDDLISLSVDLLSPGDSAADLLAAATEDAGGTTLHFDTDNSLHLQAVALSSLSEDDFRFI